MSSNSWAGGHWPPHRVERPLVHSPKLEPSRGSFRDQLKSKRLEIGLALGVVATILTLDVVLDTRSVPSYDKKPDTYIVEGPPLDIVSISKYLCPNANLVGVINWIDLNSPILNSGNLMNIPLGTELPVPDC